MILKCSKYLFSLVSIISSVSISFACDLETTQLSDPNIDNRGKQPESWVSWVGSWFSSDPSTSAIVPDPNPIVKKEKNYEEIVGSDVSQEGSPHRLTIVSGNDSEEENLSDPLFFQSSGDDDGSFDTVSLRLSSDDEGWENDENGWGFESFEDSDQSPRLSSSILIRRYKGQATYSLPLFDGPPQTIQDDYTYTVIKDDEWLDMGGKALTKLLDGIIGSPNTADEDGYIIRIKDAEGKTIYDETSFYLKKTK